MSSAVRLPAPGSRYATSSTRARSPTPAEASRLKKTWQPASPTAPRRPCQYRGRNAADTFASSASRWAGSDDPPRPTPLRGAAQSRCWTACWGGKPLHGDWADFLPSSSSSPSSLNPHSPSSRSASTCTDSWTSGEIVKLRSEQLMRGAGRPPSTAAHAVVAYGIDGQLHRLSTQFSGVPD